MNYVLEAIISSNMQYLFKGINDPYYYWPILRNKYQIYLSLSLGDYLSLMTKTTEKDHLKTVIKKHEAIYNKRKKYPAILEDNYDDAIQLISEWLDRRSESKREKTEYFRACDNKSKYEVRQDNYYQNLGNKKGGKITVYKLNTNNS